MRYVYWLDQSSFASKEAALAHFDTLDEMSRASAIDDALEVQGIEGERMVVVNAVHIIAHAQGTAGRDLVAWALSTMEDIVMEDARACSEDEWMQGYDGLGVEYCAGVSIKEE